MTLELGIAAASALVSVGALVVAILAMRASGRASRAALALEQGRAATELRTTILNAQDRHVNRGIQLGPIVDSSPTTPQEKAQRDRAIQALRAAAEAVLNSYENACSQYLADKVDKQQFLKDWGREIQQLVRSADFGPYFDKASTAFKDILRVYKELDNK